MSSLHRESEGEAARPECIAGRMPGAFYALAAGVRSLAAALVAGTAGAGATACDSGPEPVHLATAHQVGPVGYRDPAGGVSPDGRQLAYTQGRELLLHDLAGGDSA